jgi:SAM-dependent methyltransferase
LLHILHELPIHEGCDVLDYGCGEGELLLELLERHAVRATGVDVNPDAIARCRAKLSGAFFAEAFQAQRFAPASFDLIVNIGASPGLAQLLGEIRGLLRRGGRALIGDIYWQREPSADYLSFLGMTNVITPTHEDHLQTLAAAGFTVERTLLSSLSDWDRYEDRYDANMLEYARAHPNDPECVAFEARRARWREMYLTHGRGTMGFALYQARLAG